MQRPIFADPKTAFAFKRMFGPEDHKDVLVAFLNNMLDLDEAHGIVGVELLPRNFFREAENLTVVPEVLAEHPFIDALEAARAAGFTAAEWEAYILAGIAIQNERSALAVAERWGEQRGCADGLRQGAKTGGGRGGALPRAGDRAHRRAAARAPEPQRSSARGSPLHGLRAEELVLNVAASPIICSSVAEE